MRLKISTRILRVSMLLLLALPLNLLSAGHIREESEVSAGLRLESNWYGSIPSEFQDDPLPLRSHLALNTSVFPFSVVLSPTLEFSTGLAITYVSPSLSYGVSVWRAFFAFGPTLELTIAMNPRFSFTTAGTLLVSSYVHIKDPTLMVRLSAIAELELLPRTDTRHSVTLSFPLHVDLRSDYTSVSAGVGLRWRYYSKAPAPEEFVP